MIEALKNAPALSFIDDRTVDELLEEMVGDYESFMTAAAGTPQKLSRASPARMVLAAAAAQIYGALQLIDRAGKQNLLQYSYGGFLDNLALFKGVTRKPASPASVLLRFTLSAARDAATGIPQGTRVSTVDGVYFAADQYAEIPAGSLTVDVRATCTLPGAITVSLPELSARSSTRCPMWPALSVSVLPAAALILRMTRRWQSGFTMRRPATLQPAQRQVICITLNSSVLLSATWRSLLFRLPGGLMLSL